MAPLVVTVWLGSRRGRPLAVGGRLPGASTDADPQPERRCHRHSAVPERLRRSSHEWYPPSCCDNRDCYPMGAGQREPDPRYTPSGWLLHDGRLVPFVDARVSPDGKFHVCRIGGRTNASIVHPTGDKPCLYVPPTAF